MLISIHCEKNFSKKEGKGRGSLLIHKAWFVKAPCVVAAYKWRICQEYRAAANCLNKLQLWSLKATNHVIVALSHFFMELVFYNLGKKIFLDDCPVGKVRERGGVKFFGWGRVAHGHFCSTDPSSFILGPLGLASLKRKYRIYDKVHTRDACDIHFAAEDLHKALLII